MTTTFNSRHLAVLTLGVMFQVASAATYYSDPATGTAAGDGSATAPWPKLQELADGGKLARLHGGDTLLLRGGNHGNENQSHPAQQLHSQHPFRGQRVFAGFPLRRHHRHEFLGRWHPDHPRPHHSAIQHGPELLRRP
ncbi:MAG: hypothetical protein K9N23_08765 [Akkermansiaceae bacterium]|nr:hypothetical protein [Akkermansiaceae bacterium]